MNKITFTGRVASDIDSRMTMDGTNVCTFRVAVKRPYAKDTTDFFNCIAWRSTSDFVSRYFSKGQMILVSGYLTSRQYQDKNGNNRTIWEIVCDEVEFCGDKKQTTKADSSVTNNQNDSFQKGVESNNSYGFDLSDENVPF